MGILIGSVGCDADAPFHLLVQLSQHENRKRRDLAVELVHRSVRASKSG